MFKHTYPGGYSVISLVELKILQDKKHKIKKREVYLDIAYPKAETASELDTVEVSGIPAKANVDAVRFYFETQMESEECDDVVKDVRMVQPGVAHIQFISPEGKFLLLLGLL